MILAELEVWHTRPVTPTRRVALGHLVLPVDPAPGFGGLLLGAVVAAYTRDIDPELVPDLHRLTNQIGRSERIVQPRLRHRFQVDRHGLARTTHRLVGDGEQIRCELHNSGTPLQQVLGALYAVERLAVDARAPVVHVVHKALHWRGDVGPALIAHLAGSASASRSYRAFIDPRAWALDVLGFPPGTVKPVRREVVARFRERLLEIHPDQGGDASEASRLIAEVTEARHILLA